LPIKYLSIFNSQIKTLIFAIQFLNKQQIGQFVKNKLFLNIFIMFSLTIYGNNEVKNMIIPTPQIIKLTNGSFNLSDKITVGISDDQMNFTASQIINSLKNTFDINASIVQGRGVINLNLVKGLANIDVSDALYNQAYELNINKEGIDINAVSPKALFYGAMSLVQLIERSSTKEIPAVEISDWPDMELRGISDDISRGQVSNLENFKRIIDFIARYKMNVYMPYLEDMLQFKSYPSIGKGRGALSNEEVSEIISYAAERFIDVIPAFQTLGHYENILISDEFVDYAEFPGAASLAVTEEKTYVFLENMLNEVFDFFPSKYINIGADESYDVGYGKSAKLTKQVGKAEVHAEHYKKIFQICEEKNKKVMMYGDVILNHTDILDLIPKNVTIIDWHYGAKKRYPSTDIFKEAGFEFIVSPSVWNFRTTFPTYQIALPNIKTITHDGILNGSRGMINSNWGDFGAETFKELVLFGYAWSAQCSWNYEASSLSQFNNNFFADFFGIDDSRLSSIYKTFSTVFNQIQWNEVWRHPALELPNSAWWAPRINKEEISSWMNWTLPNVYKTLDDYENIVTKNKEHFEFFRFLIHLDYWYLKKLEANHYIREIIELNDLVDEVSDDPSSEEENESEIISIKRRLKEVSVEKLIAENISELKILKSEYKSLWLKYYKKENLNMIMNKFDRLISYFEETQKAINDNVIQEPTIESEWIYASKRKQSAYKKAEFKREFTIRNEVTKAQIQLMADTHAKIYINDKFVGEIYSKRSLSLLTEYDRYLFLDATKYIQKGKNKIKIEAQNYRSTKGAGINFIADITTTNGSFQILSDEKWKSRSIDPKRTWKKSITKDYKYKVIAPNFDLKRASWIER
jgi:hexosaminidase